MKKLLLFFIFVLSGNSVLFASNPYFLNKKGIKSYNEKKFATSLKYFNDAYKTDERPEYEFNKGVSLYKLKKYDNASSLFYKLSIDNNNVNIKEKSLYNLGVINYKKKKFKQALSYLKRALKLSPEDKDARINYEIILNKLKENNRKNKNSKSNQKNKKKEKNRNNKQKKKDSNKKKRKGQNKSENERKRKNSLRKKKNREKIDKKILNLYSDDKKLLKKSIIKRFSSKSENPEKDW